jgi:2-C-methyl-D-erythritol 2,4-cyclodiphosphate synthase
MNAHDFRVGFGYDIHRLESGRPLILGGVAIEYPLGLAGHSDADVIVHAVIDALLGAAGMADIGLQFPNTDQRWHNASSVDLLSNVTELLKKRGWGIVNVDSSLVAEAPRIAPHIEAMKAVLSSAMGIDEPSIGIKATTSEGVGPEGRGEAMSARAIALLARDTS